MGRLSKLVCITTAALGAAVVMYIGFGLPAATRQLAPAAPGVVYGAYHVHTDRSDGSGTLDDVAKAAARAGLQFVIVTDHGDATRVPEPPHYRDGVLLIDAVEISTASGHLVALGLDRASPYPLGAEARDTIEDVHRLGGWTVVAHPDSSKSGLRWLGARQEMALDGIEWLNADSEWRNKSSWRLLAAAGHYLLRPPEAIASIFDRPSASLRRWDQLNTAHHITGLAAVDAHARIGLDETAAPGQTRTFLARPSYEDMFRTIVQAVELGAPLTGEPSNDATAILESMRHGRTFTVVNALAHPGQVTFTATDGTLAASMGESLPSDRPVQLYATVPAPADATVALLRNGRTVAAGRGSVAFQHVGAAANYRVEVSLPGHAVPWIVTNAIRTGAMPATPGGRPPATTPPPVGSVRQLRDRTLWAVEKHPASTGEISAEAGAMALQFGLAPGRTNGQYAALAYPLGGQDSFDRITLTLRASADMRVSIQVRLPIGPDGERWQRSVYVGPTSRTVTLRLEEFEPTNANTSRRPIVARLESLLVVVDTWHTSPGTVGTVWVSRVSLASPNVNGGGPTSER
ncbi:MAG: CehA/McbA family metallohydrolase [Acidobacteria bacterium]|jgi:hypothetical protein|nr:CehA/McbA family metallohydrolase [Acidobacteriota bacterium]